MKPLDNRRQDPRPPKDSLAVVEIGGLIYDKYELADGPRYKMLGNGVTASVSEWIGRQLIEVVSREQAA